MLGERLKRLRKVKGYSLSELSELAGVSKSYLSYLERNIQTNPSLQFLNKIAVTLETDLDFLLNGESDNDKPDVQVLDEEWRRLVQRAIAEGLSKEDFIHFKEYMEFQKWQGTKKTVSKKEEEEA
ncbi:helix-turn-helix domain-containing protein [Bacillus sp. m3-13]|uniref:helix-turn-helix domain-containing protein n=1 Tax=Bacillus sp. m3-13 TaxID=406124 RepID=UPI0001E89CD5|nr:helix-turn-helix domain-containing protein [Bacillus sp. m3-13]